MRSRDDIKALNITFPFGAMPDETIRKIRQCYAASVTYVDDLIGFVLGEIDEDTIVVVMGDHGT